MEAAVAINALASNWSAHGRAGAGGGTEPDRRLAVPTIDDGRGADRDRPGPSRGPRPGRAPATGLPAGTVDPGGEAPTGSGGCGVDHLEPRKGGADGPATLAVQARSAGEAVLGIRPTEPAATAAERLGEAKRRLKAGPPAGAPADTTKGAICGATRRATGAGRDSRRDRALASRWGALGERDREAELSRIGGSLYRLSMEGVAPIATGGAISAPPQGPEQADGHLHRPPRPRRNGSGGLGKSRRRPIWSRRRPEC